MFERVGSFDHASIFVYDVAASFVNQFRHISAKPLQLVKRHITQRANVW